MKLSMIRDNQVHIPLRKTFRIRRIYTMSEFKNLTLEVADGIAVLAISRPAALNALNSETLDELNVALTEIEARDDVKVLILTGGPDKKGNEFKSFVAGADIAEMVNFTAPEARAFGIKASEPFFKLMNMRQVTIAAVNGFALGGGCEISMACDIRIASENAIFGQTGPRVGSFDAGFGSSYLARVVGQKKAREIWFLCRKYNAQEALDMGLVNKVVPLEQLEDEYVQWAEEMMLLSPLALRMIKAGLNAELDGQAGIQELAGDATLLYYLTDEAQEGKNAFLEKRKPNFKQYPKFP